MDPYSLLEKVVGWRGGGVNDAAILLIDATT